MKDVIPYIAIALSVFGFLVSVLSMVFALGKVVQRLNSHEQLDTERHTATQDMLTEIRTDVKGLLKA